MSKGYESLETTEKTSCQASTNDSYSSGIHGSYIILSKLNKAGL